MIEGSGLGMYSATRSGLTRRMTGARMTGGQAWAISATSFKINDIT